MLIPTDSTLSKGFCLNDIFPIGTSTRNRIEDIIWLIMRFALKPKFAHRKICILVMQSYYKKVKCGKI